MDFIELSLFLGYKYVLVMVCMFLYWTENFLNRQVIASSVAKVLLEKIIPTWGTHQGSHLPGQAFQQVCTI